MNLALFHAVSSQSYLFDKRGIGWNQTIQENNPEHKRQRDPAAGTEGDRSEGGSKGARPWPKAQVRTH